MDMTGQPMLWVPAVEAANTQVLYEGHHGWSLHISYRRSGETWGSHRPIFHGGLTTNELLDVLCAEWACLLGLEDG